MHHIKDQAAIEEVQPQAQHCSGDHVAPVPVLSALVQHWPCTALPVIAGSKRAAAVLEGCLSPKSSSLALVLSSCAARAQIMVASTSLFLLAGRFGLAPTANRQTTAGLKLQDTGRSGQFTSDPAGGLLHVCCADIAAHACHY